jgi:hypothetical protein
LLILIIYVINSFDDSYLDLSPSNLITTFQTIYSFIRWNYFIIILTANFTNKRIFYITIFIINIQQQPWKIISLLFSSTSHWLFSWNVTMIKLSNYWYHSFLIGRKFQFLTNSIKKLGKWECQNYFDINYICSLKEN